ncbi:uncharacterized protein C8Q71DRAFT_736602 [Rhodofomes roseus]|uniref:Secreted protein n=1 Tax=Rhodofomes roseus TaxID=34475 RepID=A0ABQ8KS41_9APHY|nr:uncharacterized protein C8Q71DRAFT_736602 [Rhodofomes roseus]KAH9841369.1 hypothetical protein C8Q71DRAFT_736602 [Rhodofomes roseus]
MSVTAIAMVILCVCTCRKEATPTSTCMSWVQEARRDFGATGSDVKVHGELPSPRISAAVALQTLIRSGHCLKWASYWRWGAQAAVLRQGQQSEHCLEVISPCHVKRRTETDKERLMAQRGGRRRAGRCTWCHGGGWIGVKHSVTVEIT